MNVLTAYIVKEVIKGSLIALLLLLTLFNLFTFSDELKDLGKGSYGLKEILLYLALTSPRVFYELIPSSALLGSLFVVGAMANNREIIAMRAIGLSVFWVIRAIMLAGLILVLISLAVGEFVAPWAERTAQMIRTTAQNEKVVMHSRYGMWLREGNNFINVRQIHEDGLLGDISIYQLNEQLRLDLLKHAETARYLGQHQWRLEKIRWSEVSSRQVFAGRTSSELWKTSIDPDLLNIVVVKADNLSLYDLYMYIGFLKENNQKSQSFELAFWSRLINPLVTFVMLMVSAPFVIGIRRGIGAGGRMMIGIIIGMTFNIFDKIAGHLGLVYGFNPMLMAILPSVLVFCGAAYAVSRVR
ncbi:LPS export ABC transporter permease LptG [Methylomarinum sp. Ch1-1]|uniref:LPS export ABC transporter permease LptG n=1 Tax=Methylomarinum roseum TaxID=3067653 RepID=A0AAU7NXN9_9GAMM|nr:LPS export ABC transporter permease LptG [Methylomarinum sp. Ch1-1]MDP4522082.1 LPS export ABC transporter permease LptG [Methylomarinum sp. Ch1-1]